MTVISEIPKNRTEIIRLTRQSFRGTELVDMRVHYLADGEWLPTKKGLAVSVKTVGPLIEALIEAEGTLPKKEGVG